MARKSKLLSEENTITADNAVHYLLEKALIDRECIVKGNLKIIYVGRKNRNLKIIRENDKGLFLKQPNPTDLYGINAIKKESLFYTLVQTNRDFDFLKEIVPKMIDFDYERNIMITELLPDSKSWNEYSYSKPDTIKNTDYTSKLGTIMASYHREFELKIENHRIKFLPRFQEPVTSLIRPGPEIFKDLSTSSLELLKIIQQYPAFLHFTDELFSNWEEKTLVHGDIKFDNIIISPIASKNHEIKIRITDWELVGIGDAGWDIGGIFHEFIRFWVSSLLINSNESINNKIDSKYSIRLIHPSIRSFWYGYIKSIPLQAKKSDELLVRSAKYCAARLIQSSYEMLYFSEVVTNLVIYLIQIGLNIFEDTSDAIINLLGIPFRSI